MDVATHKEVGFIIHYLSMSQKKLVSTFLGLFTLEGQSAPQVAEGILNFFTSVSFDFASCIKIGTDGCNVMFKKNNFVYMDLQQKNNDFC